MHEVADADHPQRLRSGLLYGLGAYVWWGLMPLYFRVVLHVPAGEILAHRIVWCSLLLAGILTLAGRWPDVIQCLSSRKTALVLFVCSLLLTLNWFVYIYAAISNRIAEASLGYFLLPLFSVIVGLVVFRERLRPAQWLGLAIAGVGVLYLIVSAGEWPWIALTIAVSFTTYAVLRKLTPVDGLVGLFVETLFLVPFSAAFVLWWLVNGQGTFANVDLGTDWLLLLSGPVTAVPLICFGQAARRLPLTAMGFMQYLSPSLQLLLAIYLYDEPFRRNLQICFACIWAALGLVTIDSMTRRVGWEKDEVLVTDE